MIRVAIADDQELVRYGLRMILEGEPDVQVVGEAVDGSSATELVAREQPDVLLLDVRMPGQDGLSSAGEIVAAWPGTKVLILTTFDLDDYVYRALRAGAAGFLLKDMPGEEIVAAVRQATRGGDALLAPAVTRRLVARFTVRRPAVPGSAEALRDVTAREVDVLRLVARGLTNGEIADELWIAESTVKTHVARLLTKLGLRDRLQIVIFAYENGLLDPAWPAE